MENEGWNFCPDMNRYVRILKDCPWYAEFKIENRHFLSPATLIFLYLKAHCDEFEIENTIDSLFWESSFCLNENEVPSNDNKWVSGVRLHTQLTTWANFVVKYKDLTISNRSNERDGFDDFYLMLLLNHKGEGYVSGWRQNVQYVHYTNQYLHSHLSSYTYTNGFDLRSFCTGHSSTPINSTFRHLREFVRDINILVTLSAPLLGYEKASNFDSYYDDFERLILGFKAAWLPLIQHESLAGGPFKYLRNNIEILQTAKTEDVYFDEFAKEVALNAEDPRLQFNITASAVLLKNTPGLVEFAKETGFYEKCFAFANSPSSSSYNASVVNNSAGINKEDFIKFSKKATLCRSPFKWKGERLSVILNPTSKSIQNAKQARINTAKRTFFDQKLTGYFRQGLLLQSQ